MRWRVSVSTKANEASLRITKIHTGLKESCSNPWHRYSDAILDSIGWPSAGWIGLSSTRSSHLSSSDSARYCWKKLLRIPLETEFGIFPTKMRSWRWKNKGELLHWKNIESEASGRQTGRERESKDQQGCRLMLAFVQVIRGMSHFSQSVKWWSDQSGYRGIRSERRIGFYWINQWKKGLARRTLLGFAVASARWLLLFFSSQRCWN